MTQMTEHKTVDCSFSSILNVTVPIMISMASTFMMFLIDRAMLAAYSMDSMNAGYHVREFCVHFRVYVYGPSQRCRNICWPIQWLEAIRKTCSSNLADDLYQISLQIIQNMLCIACKSRMSFGYQTWDLVLHGSHQLRYFFSNRVFFGPHQHVAQILSGGGRDLSTDI
ncbi:MAG: hypothetical protein LBT90_02585, partial [Holosporaceae bacterium]|nr:hypothetical protein [Holosporaceae bacterium]